MFVFPQKQEVLEIQEKLINSFGGIHGVRDEHALESALAAVENRLYYEHINLATCAATYAYHLTQAHAFIDGNKRIAAAVAEIFLELNGAKLTATNDQIVALFLDIASGKLTRDEVEQIFNNWVVF